MQTFRKLRRSKQYAILRLERCCWKKHDVSLLKEVRWIGIVGRPVQSHETMPLSRLMMMSNVPEIQFSNHFGCMLPREAGESWYIDLDLSVLFVLVVSIKTAWICREHIGDRILTDHYYPARSLSSSLRQIKLFASIHLPSPQVHRECCPSLRRHHRIPEKQPDKILAPTRLA